MSYAEVIKHSATVQVTNTVPLLARRLWNVLLARAYDDLPHWERVRVHRVPVGEVLDALGTTTRNTEHLKDLLTALATTPVEWNVLGKDNVEEWGVSALLAEAKIRGGQVEFSYGPTLRERLHNPRLYVRISLSIQNRFASKHSLALYELCVDYLDVARGRGETPWIPLDRYRAMMGVEDGQYARFAQLNQRVVKESVGEVNKRSDVAVEVEYQKDGRAVTALKFRVRPAVREGDKKALPVATRAGRAAGLPLPISPSPVESDVLDLWLGALSAAERAAVEAAAVARLEPVERDGLKAARAEKRFAPVLEMAYHVRLRGLYHESLRGDALPATPRTGRATKARRKAAPLPDAGTPGPADQNAPATLFDASA